MNPFRAAQWDRVARERLRTFREAVQTFPKAWHALPKPPRAFAKPLRLLAKALRAFAKPLRPFANTSRSFTKPSPPFAKPLRHFEKRFRLLAMPLRRFEKPLHALLRTFHLFAKPVGDCWSWQRLAERPRAFAKVPRASPTSNPPLRHETPPLATPILRNPKTSRPPEGGLLAASTTPAFSSPAPPPAWISPSARPTPCAALPGHGSRPTT